MAGPLDFDDLIPQASPAPKAPAGKAPLAFDDLVQQGISQGMGPAIAAQHSVPSGMAGWLQAAAERVGGFLADRPASPGINRIGGDVRTYHPTTPTPEGDVVRSLGRGVLGLGDAAIGLGNIVSGGAAGNAVQAAGYDSQAVRKAIDAEDTPGRQQAREALNAAQGMGETLAALMQHPGNIGHAIVESAPSMLAGGAIGRGALALAPRIGGAAAAGLGEGAIAAGQQAEQTRQANGGTLTPLQAGIAVASGAATGLLGMAGAKIGRALGIADIDAQLSGDHGADIARGLIARVAAGAGLEGAEEMSQSAQEQVAANVAQGRPVLEGVGKNAAMGAVVGGAMGGAGGLRSPNVAGQQQVAPTPSPAVDPRLSAAQQAVPGAIQNYLNPTEQAAPAPAPTVQPSGVPSQAPAGSPQPVPFAGSQDISAMLDNIGGTPEARAQSLELLSPVEFNIEDSRRGVLSIPEQQRLAGLLGLKGNDHHAFTRKVGEAWNPEQIRSATTLVQSQLTDIMSLQQSIANGTATDADRAAFVQNVADFRAASTNLLGARAEAGRALAAMRRTPVTDFRAVLDKVGGIEGADKLAAAFGEAMKSGGVQNAAKLLQKGPGLIDYYWRSAILSGLSTHSANLTGNLLMLPVGMAQRYTAAGIGTGKRLLGLNGQTTFGEANAYTRGMVGSILDGLRAAQQGWKTGESQGVQSVTMDDIAGNVSMSANPNAPKMQRLFGIPFRALAAGDSLFATINAGAERFALAHRLAFEEKRSGRLPQGVSVEQRMSDLYANPTPDMIEEAGRNAARQTFNTKGGAVVQGLQHMKRDIPALGLIIPFLRTPANIMHTATGELGRRQTYADLKAGGAKGEQAMSRVVVAGSMIALSAMLASNGALTGAAPKDEKERAAFYASGKQPYSIKIGDTWVGYGRLQPFSSWLSSAVDLINGEYEGKAATDIAGELVGSFYRNFLDATFMRGINDFLGAITDPDRRGGSFLSRLGASVVQPFSALSQAASAHDPYLRDADGLLGQIQYRTPGLREQLPPKIDVLGQPVPNPGHGVGPLISGVRTSEESADPVRQEIGRLKWAPPETPRYIESGKKRYPLSPELRREYTEVQGKLIARRFAQLQRKPGWNRLDDDAKRERLGRETTAIRKRLKLSVLAAANGNRKPLDQLRKREGL